MKNVLAINGGSSSIKFALYEANEVLRKKFEGSIERIGLPNAFLRVKGIDGADNFSKDIDAGDQKQAVGFLMDWIEKRIGDDALSAVGHRIVQGSPKDSETQLVTKELLDDLYLYEALDPEHLPQELMIIEAFIYRFPDTPQVLCFDTAFHHDMPRVAKILAIPRRYEAKGVRRLGFHGISYSFLMRELVQIAGKDAFPSRVILAHLGSGASLAAVENGKSIDTSMGFTPSAGLVMGTRCGDLDPGLNYYLARTEGTDASQFQHMVDYESGLLGISETSSDMKDLLINESSDVRAKEAIEVFCYQTKKWIGSYSAALGGLDTLVFAGGIGENVPVIRSRICKGLEFLGVDIDENLNKANEGIISKKMGKVAVRIIRTDEEFMIAQQVSQMLKLDTAI
jgi:acetate kinase